MALTSYGPYSISLDLPGGVLKHPEGLQAEIASASLSSPISHITTSGDDVLIWFGSSLSPADYATLDGGAGSPHGTHPAGGLIAAHNDADTPQYVASESQSTTTSATFQDKVTITIPPQVGTVRLAWRCEYGTAVKNRDAAVRIYNSTDNLVLGTAYATTYNSTDIMNAGSFFYISMTGPAKTFKIQFRSPDGVSTMFIQCARIEARRL